MDLAVVLWGSDPISARRLLALIQGIGPRSALHRAMDPRWMWSAEDELLATLCELTDLNGRRTHAAFLKGQPPRPLRIPRPSGPKRHATSEDLVAMFGRGSVRYEPRDN